MNSFSGEISLRHLQDAIILTWKEAEHAVLERAGNGGPLGSSGEVKITDDLVSQLWEATRKANANCRFANALSLDLLNSGIEEYSHNSHTISRGLFGSVTQHSQEGEKHTGGDLGIVLQSPRFFSDLRNIDSVRCGTLRQAKLKRSSRAKWGKLTPNQQKLLPDRLRYLSLLLYRRAEPSGNLEGLKWFPCHRSANIEDISERLRNDDFASVFSSESFMGMIFRGEFGTRDKKILADVIAPGGSRRERSVEIRIDWPDGKPPSLLNYRYARLSVVDKKTQTVTVGW